MEIWKGTYVDKSKKWHKIEFEDVNQEFEGLYEFQILRTRIRTKKLRNESK
jgi:hypothetical protein